MSDEPPKGSLRWWADTFLIAGAGVALAVWLWDGPFFSTTLAPATAPATNGGAPRDLGDLLDAGCLTQDDLRALLEDGEVSVNCFADAPGGAPERRLFP